MQTINLSIQYAYSCQGEDASQSLSLDSLRFEFSTIRAVTNDFSNANMVGHGGFGSVYKVTKQCSFLLCSRRTIHAHGLAPKSWQYQVAT